MRAGRCTIAALAVFTFIQSVSLAQAADATAIDPALCQNLVKHVPSADVTYQPGVDVYGKPVAPADLPGSSSLQLPSKINIPITINIAKALNLNTSQYPYNMLGEGTEAMLGTLTVQGNEVLFNGKPLSGEQQDNLAVLCMKQTGSKP